ncbi:MAG: hypothetical protein MUO54_00990, partial [Anaerolineales bacterium]|nr:hypothetical protein [Anaerolineales bacterium]
MTRKQWVLITVAVASVHASLVYLLTPISGEIIFSRFDGNAYASPWEQLLVGLFFLLYFPYFLMNYLLDPLRFLPPVPAYYLAWGCNS